MKKKLLFAAIAGCLMLTLVSMSALADGIAVTLADDTYLDIAIKNKDGEPVEGINAGDSLGDYKISLSVKPEYADTYKTTGELTITVGEEALTEGYTFRPSGDIDFEGVNASGDIVIDAPVETFEIAALEVVDQNGLAPTLHERTPTIYIGDEGLKVFITLEDGQKITDAVLVSGVAEEEVPLIAEWDEDVGAWAVKDSSGGQSTLSGIIEDVKIVVTIE